MRKFIGTACIVLGMLCLLSAVGLVLYNRHEAQSAAAASADMLLSIQQELAKTKEDMPAPQPESSPAIMPITKFNGYDCIGILSIPVLELELPVLSGWSYEQLKLAPCQYYGSCYGADFVIAAHNYVHHFGYIGKLSQEDTLYFTDMEDTTYRYCVTEVEVIPPSAADQVKDTGDALILFTCNYSGNKRVVVRCAYE